MHEQLVTEDTGPSSPEEVLTNTLQYQYD